MRKVFNETKFPGALIDTAVGFMHKDPNAPPNATYYKVYANDTGYVEVVHLLFNNKKAEF